MKKTLFALFMLFSFFPIRAQELVWEKMQKESEGGWVEDLVVGNGKIWMSCPSELFVSNDNGVTWNYAVKSNGQNIPYKGTVNYTFGADRKIIVCGDSIFFGNQFSADNGATWKTWTMDGSTLPTYYFAPTVMHIRGKKLFMGALYNGFFQSADLGKTFSYMNTGIPNMYGYYEPARSIEFYNNQPVIATTSGLYRWNGASWLHPASNGLPTTVVNTATVKLIDRIRFLNSMWIVSTNYGVYYSNDQGNNWLRFNAIPQITGLSNWNLYSSPAVFYNVDVTNEKIIVSYESNIYISSDGGATWQFSQMTNRVDVRRIVSVSSDLLAATSGGIYRSTDNGITWSKSSKGFERKYYTGIYAKNGEGYLASVGSGILKSSERGKILAPFNEGIDLLKYVRINAVSSDQVFSTQTKYYTYGGSSVPWDYTLYQSGHDVAQWDTVSNLPVQALTFMQASSNGSYAVSGVNPTPGGNPDTRGLYITDDKGQSWKKVFTNVTQTNKTYDDLVSSMLFENDTIYVGTMVNGIYKSWDQGTTWTAINNGIKLPDMTKSSWWDDSTAVSNIAILKRFENNLYAIGENYINFNYGVLHHSTDGGKHWNKKDFSSLGADHFGVIPYGLTVTEDGTLYAQLYNSDYVTTFLAVSYDTGDTWEIFANDFPDGDIYTFNVIGDYFYACGKTGLWRLNNPDSLKDEPEVVITHTTPEELRSDISAYPNPFNTTITIEIPTPRNGITSVEIFSCDGRKILKNEVDSDDKNFVWNGEDNVGNVARSGMYLVRVTLGNKITTRKIIKH
jgi:photosystem II stability/assembly factor-like uncharacterized protein